MSSTDWGWLLGLFLVLLLSQSLQAQIYAGNAGPKEVRVRGNSTNSGPLSANLELKADPNLVVRGTRTSSGNYAMEFWSPWDLSDGAVSIMPVLEVWPDWRGRLQYTIEGGGFQTNGVLARPFSNLQVLQSVGYRFGWYQDIALLGGYCWHRTSSFTPHADFRVWLKSDNWLQGRVTTEGDITLSLFVHFNL